MSKREKRKVKKVAKKPVDLDQEFKPFEHKLGSIEKPKVVKKKVKPKPQHQCPECKSYDIEVFQGNYKCRKCGYHSSASYHFKVG